MKNRTKKEYQTPVAVIEMLSHCDIISASSHELTDVDGGDGFF